MDTTLKIHAEWDEEANVWVAESDDVPGLVAEADTIPDLLAKLKTLVPEMLEENGHLKERKRVDIPFEVCASVRAVATSHAH